ncbi:MAG: hypothetical protein CVV27_04925 [Candidatus Melainabacteria bacterium HGW-Melainabacteria-1]|nr:MAG: hypothetical protein CVV27_04925 [Candidatus Melainabacteria bacterium HGW-Melainabacteria-1]
MGHLLKDLLAMGLALSLGMGAYSLPALAQDQTLKAARLAHEDGRYTEAIAILSRGLKARPHDAGMLRLRAEAYQYLGNLRQAEADLRTGLTASPADPNLLEGMGWLKLFQRDYVGAEAWLRRALDQDPEHAWARLNLAHALLLQARDAEAIALYCALLQTDIRETVGQSMSKDFARLRSQGISHPGFDTLPPKFTPVCGPGLIYPSECGFEPELPADR